MTRRNINGPSGRFLGWFDPDRATRWHEATDPEDAAVSAVTGNQSDHQELYRTASGRWVLHSWSARSGGEDAYEFLSPERAREWLLLCKYGQAVTEHFETIDADPGTRQNITGDTGQLLGWFDTAKAQCWAETTDPDDATVSAITDGPLDHEELYRTAGGRWVLHSWSTQHGVEDVYRCVSSERAHNWLLVCRHLAAVDEYFRPIDTGDTTRWHVTDPETGRLLGWFDTTKAQRWTADHEKVGATTGDLWDREELYRTAGGRWVLHSWSAQQATADACVFVSPEEAKTWLLFYDQSNAETEHFWLPRPERGRPEIGGRIDIRLGEDLQRRVAAHAHEAGISEARAVRELVGVGLKALESRLGLRGSGSR